MRKNTHHSNSHTYAHGGYSFASSPAFGSEAFDANNEKAKLSSLFCFFHLVHFFFFLLARRFVICQRASSMLFVTIRKPNKIGTTETATNVDCAHSSKNKINRNAERDTRTALNPAFHLSRPKIISTFIIMLEHRRTQAGILGIHQTIIVPGFQHIYVFFVKCEYLSSVLIFQPLHLRCAASTRNARKQHKKNAPV